MGRKMEYTETEFKNSVQFTRTQIEMLRKKCSKTPSLLEQANDLNNELNRLSRKTKSDKNSLQISRGILMLIDRRVAKLEKKV